MVVSRLAFTYLKSQTSIYANSRVGCCHDDVCRLCSFVGWRLSAGIYALLQYGSGGSIESLEAKAVTRV